MGTGIAFTAAREGLRVRLVDASETALEKARGKIAQLSQSDPKTGYRSSHSQPSSLVELGSDIRVFSNCDFIIEAIFEQPDLKKSMLQKIAKLTSTTLASNTTTLPITDLATVCPSPERFIGTHFFAPVDRMDLLEIILGNNTSEQALKQALNLAVRLRKTPIVVRDGPGFFTSRVVMAYLQEAFFLLGEGVAPLLIDNVAQNAGMPIGPLTMADLTTLDLLEKIFESLAAHGRGSARYSSRTLRIIREFTSRSRFGKKVMAGVYDYGPERQEWAELETIFPRNHNPPSPDEIEHRLFAIQTIEALHAQNEGIIADSAMIDLASVLGWSYPAFRGGVASYRCENPDFENLCAELKSRFGSRFDFPGPGTESIFE
jgi:3-hydroxyacyl-CoA dehydrogenase/enoyl-CoA hydratase/3-hydroxybutyryl-CoA epimerase